MTTTNEPYVTKAIAGALSDFDQAAGPSNINEPLFKLCCDLLELSHAAPDVLSELDAERLASDRAATLGHDPASIASTWRSAEKTTRGKARVIPAPSYQNGAAPATQGFADLAAYAASRGVPAEVFERAGWSDSQLWEFEYTDSRSGKTLIGHTDDERRVYTRVRRALRLETDAGPRWRLIDEDQPKPKYWQRSGTHKDHTKAWYKLGEALVLAAQVGYLVLVNGEAGVIVAQHWGVPAVCETGGGEKLTPPQMLQTLRLVWTGPIIIALDCDDKGQKAATKKREQYRQAGYADVRALDLALGPRDDIADFCRLHQADSVAQLLVCADLPQPAPQPGAAAPATGQRTPSQAIIDQLARLGYTFRLNLVTQKIECNGVPLDDIKSHEIRTALRDEGRRQFGAVEDAIATYAQRAAYHPIRDYLDGLRWDGRARIAELAACLHTSDPPVVYADSSTCPLPSVYLHRFLVGAVGKVFDRRQQAMLVLLGPQRLGKSTLVRWLCPPALEEQYFLEEQIEPKDKDSRVRLMAKFLWEIPEFDTITRKADVGQMKNFISQQMVTVRRAYARFDTEAPALASMIGTVNNDSFFVDDTGNRRFYVLSLTHIDRAYRQIDIDQIWAETVARYRAGEPWELLPEEQAHQAERNRTYYTETPLHDYVRRYFFVTHDPTHRLTAADMIDVLRDKQVPIGLTDHQIAIQLNRVAASLGLERVRDASGRYYVGIIQK
jgi:hypothetical protein